MNQMVDVDWSQITLGEQVQHLEVEGYVVLPGLLSADHIERLKAETQQLPTTAVDYSPHQQTLPDIQFTGGAITELIAHPPTIQFLKRLFGEQLLVMAYDVPSRGAPNSVEPNV